MGRIWMPGGGGGGASSDDCTLLKAAVPAGMRAVTADSDDEAAEGTLNPDTTLADSQALSGQTFLKWNPQTKLFEKRMGSMANKGAWSSSELAAGASVAVPAGYHNGSGKVTAKSLASQTSATATAGQILSGKTAWVNGVKVTGNIPTQGGSTTTPGTANKTIVAAGRYVSGNVVVAGDPNLKPENIRKGIPIFGIMGGFEGPATNPYYLWRRGVFQNGQSVSLVGVDKIEGDHLKIYHGTRFNNFVDLTNYKFCKFITKGTNRTVKSKASVLNSSGTAVATNSVSAGTVNEVTGFIDISALSGQYQICLDGGSNNGIMDTANYYEVFLSNQ